MPRIAVVLIIRFFQFRNRAVSFPLLTLLSRTRMIAFEDLEWRILAQKSVNRRQRRLITQLIGRDAARPTNFIESVTELSRFPAAGFYRALQPGETNLDDRVIAIPRSILDWTLTL